MCKSVLGQKSRSRYFYNDSFKHKVCKEFMTGQITKTDLGKKHKIGGKNTILNWLRCFNYVPQSSNSMKIKQQENLTTKQKSKVLQTKTPEVELLEKELEEKKLQIEMYSRMIDLAEKEFGVQIRKK